MKAFTTIALLAFFSAGSFAANQSISKCGNKYTICPANFTAKVPFDHSKKRVNPKKKSASKRRSNPKRR